MRSSADAGHRLSADRAIPMANSIMLATARAWNGTRWTQDADFEDVPGVKYVTRAPDRR